MRRGSGAGALLLLLLAWQTTVELSECLQMTVRLDNVSSVTLFTELPSDRCSVCTVGGKNRTETSCDSSLALPPGSEVRLLFNCSRPAEEAFTVNVTRTIECTKDACAPTTVETQPSLFSDFTRIFTWMVTAPEKTVVGLNILGEGLRETSTPCKEGYQYVVAASEMDAKAPTQYCPSGSVTHLELLNGAVVSLRVAPKTEVQSVLFQTSAGPLQGKTVVVTVDKSTTVVVGREGAEPECNVCAGEASAPPCDSTWAELTDVKDRALRFSCLKPHDFYGVEITKAIECNQSACLPAAGEVDPNLLKDFKRSLTWRIAVPDRTVLSLDFDGLKPIAASETCPDGYRYSVSSTKSNGQVKSSSYCRGGTLTHLELLRHTVVSVEVPRGEELDQTMFRATAARRAGRLMSVIPDQKTNVIVSRALEEPDCSVCTGEPPLQKCDVKELIIKDPGNRTVEFTCPRPQDVFTVMITRDIDIEASQTAQLQSSLFPDFNRTFTWYLSVGSGNVVLLDFPESGMQQIPNGEACPNGHTFTVGSYLRGGPTTISTLCKGGPVTSILLHYRGFVSLQVPGDEPLETTTFQYGVGPQMQLMATMKVSLPRGVSDTQFITPNYPAGFPDEQQMVWNFSVPGMHNYSLRFHEHTAPECLAGEVTLKYKPENKGEVDLPLTGAQLQHQQGNFKMTLLNCATNVTLQGLALKFSVSVMRSGHPVLCTVDLSRLQDVSLQLDKVGSDPYCEMRLDSKLVEEIRVPAGGKAKLSFLDCPIEDVRLAASKVIECKDLASCSGTLLAVPKLDSCLPMPLGSFAWHLRIPQDTTVNLASPSGGLRQSLPGQECNATAAVHLAEADGSSFGIFCSGGFLQKVQVHANISIRVTPPNLSKTRRPFLNVTFSEEIVETIIYRVHPQMSSPALLATPNWPEGMKPASTVSWIVALPGQYRADVRFMNVSQPKCKDRHTAITVRALQGEEELLSRREDESVEDVSVFQSFYLNMSNCVPEEGKFGAMAEIVLQKKINLLAILLGLAAFLLVLLVVLGAVCYVTKKKKQRSMNTESSIYIGKSNVFTPGDRYFAKSRSENESHVYASIDETMVYGHLLGSSGYADSMEDTFGGAPVDSYHTFTGPTNGEVPVIKEPETEPEPERFNGFLDPSETFIPSRPRTPIDRQDSLGFQDRRMVDNELYTFKNTGDINTIRLSGVDLEPQPPV